MVREGNSDGLLTERKVEIRVRKNGRKDKVIIEKSAAEGLPKGWIKKLEITNRSGRKTRRDPYFIDPKSEYIFQSFKDASRYVETGKIGHYARKLKESDIEDDDSGNGKTFSPLGSLEKEKEIYIHVRNSKRRNLSSSDEHSKNCKMNSDLSSVTSQVLEDLGKKEEAVVKRVTRSQAKANKNEEEVDLKRKIPSSSNAKSEEDTVQSRLSSASSQTPVKESVMKEEEVHDSTEKRITRSKARVVKNELSNSVVRRASKRLAGIELEPTPELKTRTKAQRTIFPDNEGTPEVKASAKAQQIVSSDDEPMPELKTRAKAQRIVFPGDDTTGKCKQPVDPVATVALNKTDIPFNKEVAKGYNEHLTQKPNAAAATTSNNRISAEMVMGIEKISKLVGRNPVIDKKQMKTALLISEVELNPVFHLDGYEPKEEMSPVSPLSRQSSAGKRLGRSSPKTKLSTSVKVTEISPLGSSNKGKYAHSSDSGNAIQRRNKLGNELSNSSVIRGTHSEMMEKNTSSFSSAFDSTLADLWKDPCIAFAIKTLTGESLHLPNTAAISSDLKNNHAKQKGITFSPETPNNANTGSEKPGFSSTPPGTVDDIWNDPCINFAIKTLTGTIPMGFEEPDANSSKSERMTITTTTATQEAEGRQNNCDYMVQQCNMMNKTVTKPGFTQSFSKN